MYTADTKQGANALAPRACICPRSERPPPGRARGQRCFVSECQVDTRAFPDEARGAIAAADCCGVSPGAAILLRLLVSIVLEPPPCTGILAAMPSALLIWPPRLAWSGVAFMGLPSSTLFTLLVATPTPTTIGIGSVNMPASSKAESGLARAPEAVAERPVPPPSPPPLGAARHALRRRRSRPRARGGGGGGTLYHAAMPMSSETMSRPSVSKSRSCGSSPQGSSSVRDVALIER